MSESLRSAREYADRLWTAETTVAQHAALMWAMHHLVDVVEQQARTIERLDGELDARAEAKMFGGRRG